MIETGFMIAADGSADVNFMVVADSVEEACAAVNRHICAKEGLD